MATRDFSITQSGGGPTTDGDVQFNFGDPTSEPYFSVETAGSPYRWRITEARGIDRKQIEQMLRDAGERALSNDFGEDVLYRATLTTGATSLGHVFFTHFARLLGDQRPIDGQRRLSDRVLLTFVERDADQPQQLLAPHTDIEVLLFVPGPAPGPLAGKIAARLIEVIAAICGFALGRVVEPPLTIFPAQQDAIDPANAMRTDPSILGLARNSISLDIFGDLVARGGADAMIRVRGAVLAYHAAMAQANPDVATMLLVTAIEALIAPRREWGKNQVTKRFIDALLILCPDAVDEILAHPNVEMALAYRRRGGTRRQRRELLSQIYDLRSRPTHTGLGLSSGGALAALASSESMRVALLSDLAQAAILAFVTSPQSFITGHPGLSGEPD